MNQGMMPLLVAAGVVALTLGAALFGVWLQLPSQHEDGGARGVVEKVMGLVATLTALVLSLLIASGQASYNDFAGRMHELAADIGEIDRAMTVYGADLAAAQQQFRAMVRGEVARIWPAGGPPGRRIPPAEVRRDAEVLLDAIGRVAPATDAQRHTQRRLLDLVASSTRLRMRIATEAEGGLSWPFGVVLLSWLALLFFGFGLFARVNATVLAAVAVGSLSVAAAMFLVLELDQPFDGLIRVAETPLRAVLHGFEE
jgi:hypothetical protein